MQACGHERKSAGGPGSIAEQEIDHDVDVLMGGGRARFEQTSESGSTVIQAAIARRYHVLSTAADLATTKRGERILGLFAPGNMTTEWNGAEAVPYPSNIAHPQTCSTTHRPANEPSLEAMTAKAIELLDRQDGSGPGFFLQVEGGSIDKQDHAANPCGQIGETVAFDRAIKVGLDFSRGRRDTLVVVTADHGHSSQILSMPSDANAPTGLISALMTADGAPMVVSYGTAGYHRSQDHTGTQVRLAAEGPGADKVVGVLDQTDLFRLISRTAFVTSQ
jgi:alkaline phosphatase/streptomycin-6-phosphatase